MSGDQSATQDWATALPRPSPALLVEILDDLGILGDERRAHAGQLLRAHALSYAGSRFLAAQWKSPHQVRDEMRQVAEHVEGVSAILKALPPMYQSGLKFAFSERAGPEFPTLRQLEAGLARLAQIGSNFASSSPAKKSKNLILKNAVGGLMLLLEKLTGNRATIRNRTDAAEPTLSSPEAHAIAKLLKVGDTDLFDLTVINVIDAINRECRNKPLSDYDHQLLVGGTITPF